MERRKAKQGLDLEKVLEVCKLNGINRLMIEGGAAIISSILNQASDNPILNILIVTVSPYMVGEGIGIKSSNIDSVSLSNGRYNFSSGLLSIQFLLTHYFGYQIFFGCACWCGNAAFITPTPRNQDPRL
jgi:hypothetical protein